MLQRINRVLVAVPDLDAACAAFMRGLGLQRGRRLAVPDVGAITEALPLGDGWVQLLQPSEDGPVARFLQQHGAGIYGIGVETPSLADCRLRVEQSGRQAHPLRLGDTELVCLKREQLPGATVWFTAAGDGPQPADNSSPFLGIHEATCLVENREGAAETYARVFGPPQRVERARNDAYGFLGQSLLYGSPPQECSIELAQPAGPDAAIARFWRKHGPSIYMVTLATDDFPRACRGFEERGVRHTREPSAPDGTAFVHPTALAGCFVGVIAV